jgi:hypothetical protein
LIASVYTRAYLDPTTLTPLSQCWNAQTDINYWNSVSQ